MADNFKNKILYICIYFSLGFLYVSMINSLLVRDFISFLFSNNKIVIISIFLLNLVFIGSLCIIHAYSFVFIKNKSSL